MSLAAEQHSWWPARLLHKHPLEHVHICGRRQEPPISSHVVNFPRLELPLSGCYETQLEQGGSITTVGITPGTALFAPPNCWNLPTWREPVRLMSLLFGKKQLGVSIVTVKAPAKPLLARKFSQQLPVTGVFPKILEALVESQAEGASPVIVTSLARALLGCVEQRVLSPVSAETHPTKSLLEDICVYLQNHYQHDISRDSVARQFNISPNYLSRIFQVQGHMTFSNYLMHVRTDRAKHLLTSYDLKLADVAARCGYRDLAYFCRVFRKLAKMTPSDYREYRKSTEGVKR
jgi:AraC-like DNA-binding protein